ncbi:hypothetical protein PR001_g8305 [Phytophthora rubi]|uniref:Uncharacterized protein n=1 Tax=Phytophthora rubi TaxID=129364 RepID=A0A6A3MWV0_9STRA|nr:hypothetical protein PR001_g8305 [Phytophthora rubi]
MMLIAIIIFEEDKIGIFKKRWHGRVFDFLNEHEAHPIDLFLRRRYYKCMWCPTFNKTLPPSPASLTDGWKDFAKTLIDKETRNAWFKSLNGAELYFFKGASIEVLKMDIHFRSLRVGKRCCVKSTQECPMCYSNSPKEPQPVRDGSRDYIPLELVMLNMDFDRRWENYLREEEGRRSHQLEMFEDGIANGTGLAQLSYEQLSQRLRDCECSLARFVKINQRLLMGMEVVIKADSSRRNEIRELKTEMEDVREQLAGVKRKERSS